MKKYQVVRDCVRMPFDRRRFRAGEIIELEDSIDPGSNFKLIERVPKEEPKKSEAKSLSQLQAEQKNLADPKSGFAVDKSKTKKAKKTAR